MSEVTIAAFLGMSLMWAAIVAAATSDVSSILVAVIAGVFSVINTIILHRARRTQKAIKADVEKIDPAITRFETALDRLMTDALTKLENGVDSLRTLADEREDHIIKIRRLVRHMESLIDRREEPQRRVPDGRRIEDRYPDDE